MIGLPLGEREFGVEQAALRIELLQMGGLACTVAVGGGAQRRSLGGALSGTRPRLFARAAGRGQAFVHLAGRGARRLAIGIGRLVAPRMRSAPIPMRLAAMSMSA